MALTKEDKINDLNERMRALNVVIKILSRKGIDTHEYVLRREYLQDCRAKLMAGYKVNRCHIYKGEEGCRPWYLRPPFESN